MEYRVLVFFRVRLIFAIFAALKKAEIKIRGKFPENTIIKIIRDICIPNKNIVI